MRIWVTGGGGLLGSALKEVLEAEGISAVCSTKGQADVANLASLLTFYKEKGPFTHLIHCAGYTKVDLAETNPEEARRANGLGMALPALLAAEKGCRFIAFSTDYVFDGQGKGPYLESDATRPSTIYGKSKLEGEQRLLSILPSACIIRTSWLFGKGGKNFVSTMCALMKEREELRVVSDQVGRPTYAKDLAGWTLKMLDASGIYHAANSGQTSWHAFAEAIREELQGQRLEIACKKITAVKSSEFASLAKRPLYSVLDTAKIERLLQSPLRPWREGLREYVREFCAPS